MDTYKVIGVMSGTSMDGLDLACCSFTFENKWDYTIHHALTIEYPVEWQDRLRSAMQASGEDLALIHADYGRYIGLQVRDFLDKTNFKADFVASHGHTVFHQPSRHFTLQIGDGNAIAAATGLPVIFDFRSLDVALGGQGAPLVPVGDRLLFGKYDYCLNLGGIANISFEEGSRRVAFEICPANMMLNHLAGRMGLMYDPEGEMARSGRVVTDLLDALNGLSYYREEGAKTLGREWFAEHILPLLEQHSDRSAEDLLRTATEHVAMQITHSVNDPAGRTMLVTGGGAMNRFLVSRIRKLTDLQLVVPDKQLVLFKEALVFAFLGVLRYRHEINCLASVTGASRDSCTGVMIP